ncbi:FtsH protease regulator HflK [Raoultella terrigena]|uniref:FtsH protease regulator HflK n=1 Tax=Raoultella terrigena TaxID=577 RepID=A0A7Z8Z9D0_RAOTE|nr:FtsH protease regulator HflK [Raoultella terrigena]
MAQPPSPESRPRVASRSRRLLIAQAILYCLLAVAGAIYLFLALFSVTGFWLPVTRLMLAAVLVALAFVENALRCEGGGRQAPPSAGSPEDEPTLLRRLLPESVQVWLRHFHQHLATTLIAAALASAFAIANIADARPVELADAPRPIAVGAFILLCFTLLLLERMLSFRPLRGWPHRQQYVGLARLMLSLFLLLTLSLLAAMAFPAPALWGIKLASLTILLVALEYALRALAALASPPAPDSAPRFLTRSLLAAQYQWPPRPLLHALDSFQQRFGVDLRQIHAFRLMGRRLVPVTLGIAVLGWLLSGLTEVGLHQRGIYERFGRPIAVLAPGLHAGLPWPFGRVVAVENGAVHELQLSDLTEAAQPDRQPDDAAEGPAPQSSWRLWDSSHATDQSQVIASAAMDQQNFQIVNMDIRVIWRIGLSDRDALNSQYQTEDLAGMIRSLARQILVTQFASKQLDELLDEQRATLASELSRQIQQRLTALHTGVELLFTRIEAIHPPAGAANAYHGVQAAQIAANALIAREQGYAEKVSREAQRNALTGLNNAEASAAENLSQARAAAVTFSAERQAWQQSGEAFITERRYHILSQALAHTPLLILDSHLQGSSEPVLDLRQYPALSDSTAPQKASTP